MNGRAIEVAREALDQVKGFIESETGKSGDIIAWYKLRNFVDLVEKEMAASVRYAIAYDDDGATVYWTTRVNDTDNYSMDKGDATQFGDRAAAAALARTLNLADDHFIADV